MHKHIHTCKVFILLVLVPLTAIPVPAGAQALLTDQFISDARSASLGFTTSARNLGAWTGRHNPGAWSDQPFLYGGLATVDLWSQSQTGARIESAAAGIGLFGVFGGGVVRQRLRYGDPEEEAFTFPAIDAPVTEYCDIYGIGLNIAQLVAPGNRYFKLGLGMNAKTQVRSYYTDYPESFLVTEQYTNYDFGGLANLRIPLTSDVDAGAKDLSSYLECSGGYVVHNATRDQFKDENLGIFNEIGLARTRGLGLGLVLGKISRTRHMLRIHASYETWKFEQEHISAGKSVNTLMRDSSKRFGLEIALADLVYGRLGRITLDSTELDETTYGIGLHLPALIPGFHLSANFARVPWIHGTIAGVDASDGTVFVERYSVQLSLSI